LLGGGLLGGYGLAAGGDPRSDFALAPAGRAISQVDGTRHFAFSFEPEDGSLAKAQKLRDGGDVQQVVGHFFLSSDGPLRQLFDRST
jgi:hypothetical protein